MPRVHIVCICWVDVSSHMKHQSWQYTYKVDIIHIASVKLLTLQKGRFNAYFLITLLWYFYQADHYSDVIMGVMRSQITSLTII